MRPCNLDIAFVVLPLPHREQLPVRRRGHRDDEAVAAAADRQPHLRARIRLRRPERRRVHPGREARCGPHAAPVGGVDSRRPRAAGGLPGAGRSRLPAFGVGG